jgi:hypothetical protein
MSLPVPQPLKIKLGFSPCTITLTSCIDYFSPLRYWVGVVLLIFLKTLQK